MWISPQNLHRAGEEPCLHRWEALFFGPDPLLRFEVFPPWVEEESSFKMYWRRILFKPEYSELGMVEYSISRISEDLQAISFCNAAATVSDFLITHREL